MNKKKIYDWVAEFTTGSKIEWFDFFGQQRWLRGKVTGTMMLAKDAIIFFRLDSEKPPHIPHEIHWEYSTNIRKVE